jgi:cellobiose phosphorylase
LDLAPGQTRRLHFLLGYCENPRNRKFEKPGLVNKAPFRKVAATLGGAVQVDEHFKKLKEYWADLLSHFKAKVPDPDVARMVNVWNQYQSMTTLNLSRSASYFESGIGRGMGYRDSNQDLLGVVHLVPNRARQRILDLAATQLSDGTCYHQYQPLTKKGNTALGSGFNDDPLWLPLSVASYINETGDTTILAQRIGYADKENKDRATLLDHLEISIAYTLKNRGPHGLPLIGHADWNDCLNLNCFSQTPGESFQLAGDIGGPKARVAESVMIAGLFCAACECMADIYELTRKTAKSKSMRSQAEKMRRVILKKAWDGKWFRRAYDAFGKPIGSKTNKEGRVFIESQAWSILGRVGLNDGKALVALDSVREHLATDNGIMLQQPPFRTYHEEYGEITSYPPGYKENAGIFTHNNTWIQIAETMLGRGDQAMAYYLSICPATKERQIDTYRCEPYVYSQMTAGKDALTPGEGKNSWLTGTAAWSFVSISQYILGIRPGSRGLMIDPCIPRSWSGFSVQRIYRGTTYQIEVKNPRGICKGVRSLTINGKTIDGNTIPPDLPGKRVSVVAELG